MIYLDYQATTPVAPEVAAAMHPWLADKFANPHSPSTAGREAVAAIDLARAQVESLVGLPGGRMVFTSGATEALNWAIKGTLERSTRRRVVTIATEHAAVLDSAEWLEGQGVEVLRLPVGPDGLIDLDHARAAIDDRTALVAAMLVNNEIGVIQPVEELAAMAHGVGAVMLCDAVQGAGRVEMPSTCDLVALSAHKLYGPKGIGGLWVRDGHEPAPLLHGGGQEQGLRSGTLSPALCVGFGTAAQIASERRSDDRRHVENLWQLFLSTIDKRWILNGSRDARYHGNANLRRDGIDAARLLSDCRGLAMSLGSACASGSGRPSHVLKALGLSPSAIRSSLRIGFGRYTTSDEITQAIQMIDEAALMQGQWPS